MEKLAIKLLEIAENFKKTPLSFVKRNINLIVILPALFGGLWQVVELASMSFSFIRFFSVGQIIPYSSTASTTYTTKVPFNKNTSSSPNNRAFQIITLPLQIVSGLLTEFIESKK